VNTALSDILCQAAHRQKTSLWLVGGPVRDALLDRPCTDWDLVCRDAKVLAQRVARILKAKCITLDEQHKIFRVLVPLPPPVTLDFAELQGKTIEQDLGRRDFTINAMARAIPDGPLVDPFGGQTDLKKKVVREVSEKAFAEDPLRLVRAFRFSAQFDCRIDPATFRHIRKHRNALSKTAPERIREELLRLWKASHSAEALCQMDRAGVLTHIFPEMEACRRTAVRYYGAGGVLKHSLQTVENLEWILERQASEARIRDYLMETIGGYPRTAWLKWGAFLHDMGKPSTASVIRGRLHFFEHEHVGAALAIRVAQRLRCSRQEVQLLALWVRHHMRSGNLAAAVRVTDKAFSRFFRDMGQEGVGMVLVSLADHYTYLRRSLWDKGKDPVEKISQKLLTSYYEERSKILPERLVTGHDVMRALKLKPGPRIGRLLETIQDAQAEGKVKTREDALAFLRRRAKAAV
jgi:tRNA nucleotidyltransferase/poly(A) polymerase